MNGKILWDSLDWEIRDQFGREFLKDWLDTCDREAVRDGYRHPEDDRENEENIGRLTGLLRQCMTSDEWEEFIGVPPDEDFSFPQCDDEEFIASLNELNDAKCEETVEITVPVRLVEKLIEWVLRKQLDD